jgi:hypothetical protein
LFDDARGRLGGIDAKIGESIKRAALGEEVEETGIIAKERAIGDGSAAAEEMAGRTIEPDDSGGGLAKKAEIARSDDRTAAERQDGRTGENRGLANDACEFPMFEIAEGGLAEARKEIGDGEASTLLDAMIKINDAAAKLAGEQAGDGGFSAAHESIEAEKRSSLPRGA